VAELFGKKIAEQAIKIAVDSIMTQTRMDGIVESNGFYIVVGTNKQQILAVREDGDQSLWTYDYKKLALSKFEITARNSLPSRLIQETMPELAGKEGDTYFWGSCIDGGIVAACSGFIPEWDEVFSKTIVAICRALVSEKRNLELTKGKHFR
jgi:hypothetical protein